MVMSNSTDRRRGRGRKRRKEKEGVFLRLGVEEK